MENCLWPLARIFGVVAESSLPCPVPCRTGVAKPAPHPIPSPFNRLHQLLLRLAARVGRRGVGGVRRGGTVRSTRVPVRTERPNHTVRVEGRGRCLRDGEGEKPRARESLGSERRGCPHSRWPSCLLRGRYLSFCLCLYPFISGCLLFSLCLNE